MLYLCIYPKSVKILSVKKGMLGSVETAWNALPSTKKLITDRSLAEPKILAPLLQQALDGLAKKSSDTEVVYVLNHQLYRFARIQIPDDIEKSNYSSYIKEKLKSVHKVDPKDYSVDFFIASYQNQIICFAYAIEHDVLTAVRDSLAQVGLKAQAIVPEHLAYYTLFEKTVRFDKKEHILYVTYEDGSVTGYMYDTFGPLSDFKTWVDDDITPASLEKTLNEKVNKYAADGHKLNRIIMSGISSDKIRQDTFTKNVGVWTNPLKRIIPNFYQDYITQIHGKSATELLPVLVYDALFGAYICHAENKSFAFGKIGTSQKITAFKQTITHSPPPKPMKEHDTSEPRVRRSIPFLKEVVLFLIIFAVVFTGLYFLLQGKTGEGISLPSFLATASPTPTLAPPTPTKAPPSPTPTVAIERKEVSIRILNGTGVRGQASGFAQLLKEKGYTNMTAGNADSADYATSEVRIKKAKMDELKGTVLADIKDSISAPKTTVLDETDTVDVEIVLGKDAN